MGEESVASEKSESVTNGKAKIEVEEKTEVVTEKSEEQYSGVKEMEVDKGDDGKFEAQDMDVGKEEVNQSKDIKEKGIKEIKEKEEKGKKEAKGEEQKKKNIPEEANEEIKSKEIEGDSREIAKREMKDKVEEGIDEVIGEEIPEEPKEEKSWKKRPRTKSSAGKKGKSKKKEPEEEKENEPKTPSEKKTKQLKTTVEKREGLKTPAPPTIDRPVRERKSVERLVATIEKDSAKEFHVGKGRGTALKDIPNVAYKLSRKKTDDTFKLLHTILFGRRGKAAQVKNNISRFSGFVWKDNEEKQLIKVKEKLDKCVKEKLVEFCDVLDVPISKGNTRKEDIISKLIDFLVSPHATSSELLAEKEQSSKSKKRKRYSKSASGSDTPAKGSAMSGKKTESTSKKGGEASVLPESEDESGEEEEACDEEGINGVPKRSDDEISEEAETEKKESDSEEESDEDKGKRKQRLAKSSAKKRSAEKAEVKKVTISKKASPPPKKTPVKSPPSRPKNNNGMNAKKSSGKKKDESDKKLPSPKKSASKESIGKKIMKLKDKPNEEKIKPSDNDLRNAIYEILKEVDFNTATFTDILKLLAKRFDMDLTSRKSSIKIIIQDELTKLADADEGDDEEDEGGAEKDKKKPLGQRVKA